MRAPNGFGTVARLSGNRRRPFIIKKVTGWNDKGHPIYEIIGYAATREEGLIILSEYNRDPWDVDRAKITMKELFELWKEKKAPKLGESNRSSLCSAFNIVQRYGKNPISKSGHTKCKKPLTVAGRGIVPKRQLKTFGAILTGSLWKWI